jgi:hypothetical protein
MFSGKQALQHTTATSSSKQLGRAYATEFLANSELGRQNRISKKEYLIPGLITVMLIASCIIYSPKKFFWNDELFSYYFLSDPSFTHMWAAFHDKLNNTPPVYFFLGWGWSRLFGASELSLRLFSSLGICVACWFTWITLRRTFRFWPTSMAVLIIFCLSTLVLSQNAEARMYGLYLAVSAAGIWLYDLIGSRKQLSWELLLLNAFIHAAIVNTHLFGCLYSGAILLAFILNDWQTKQFRWKLYASVLLGWATFLLYIPALLIQADAGNPRTWMTVPKLRYVLDVLCFTAFTYDFISKTVLLKAAALLGIALIPGILFIWGKPAIAEAEKDTTDATMHYQAAGRLLLLAYLFLVVPIAMWIFSLTIRPAFWDRYLLPSVLAWPILFASLFSLLSINLFNFHSILKKLGIYPFVYSTTFSILLVILSGILLILPVYDSVKAYPKQMPGENDYQAGYEHLPIVVLFSHDFLERMYYSPQKERYHMVLDWEVAVDSTSGLIAPQFHKHLEAWKRNYPAVFGQNISHTEEFLSKHSQFLVLGFSWQCDPEEKLKNGFCERWLNMRLANNPHYKITALKDIDYRRFYLVEKIK